MVEGCWHKEASKNLAIAMSGLNDDDISNLVKYDWLLITFGNSFCEQLEFARQQKLVRQQLRVLGRMLKEVKKIEPKVTDFASIYQTEFVDSIIAAIRVIGRFNSSTNIFKSPSPATNLVTLVKQVGVLLHAECIANKNKHLKEETEDFIALFKTRSSIRINKPAGRSRARMAKDKIQIMPTTEEVTQFEQFLKGKRQEYYNSLSAYCDQSSTKIHDEFPIDTWINLAEFTIVSIMVFNRRRVGEMQSCEIAEYTHREKVEKNSKSVFYVTLSEEAKERVQRYSRMRIRGKRDRTVSILLSADLEKCIDLLLKLRSAANIPSSNHLLFALPSLFEGQPRGIDACQVVRKLTTSSGVPNAEAIRGTFMRKHFANFCAAKGIDENTVNDVANFLGHSVRIHQKDYRGNTLDREIARISQLLEESSGQSVDHNVTTVPVKKVASKRQPKAIIEPELSDAIVRKKRQRKTDTNGTSGQSGNKRQRKENAGVHDGGAGNPIVKNNRRGRPSSSSKYLLLIEKFYHLQDSIFVLRQNVFSVSLR